MSPGWVVVICIVGMVLAPIVAILISAGLGFLVRFERCPTCGRRKLRTVQFIKATVLIDGKRAPDAWGYYKCDARKSGGQAWVAALTASSTISTTFLTVS